MNPRRLFGTDGIRGKANVPPMTPELVLRLGRAIAFVAQGARRGSGAAWSSGKTRASRATCSRRRSKPGSAPWAGACMLTGPMPTPAVANLTQSMRADAGVVISASHNPYDDNGIKIFGPDGFKLPTRESRDRALLESHARRGARHRPAHRQRREDRRRRGALRRVLQDTFPKELTLDGLKMVVDAAHGAAYRVAPLVFSELGAEVTAARRQAERQEHQQGLRRPAPRAMVREVLKQAGPHRHRARRRRRPGDHGRRARADRRRRRGDGAVRARAC
jgi:phosphoglucosamine mutase